MTIDERIAEIHERSRRIETRLTKLVEAMGVDAGGLRPVWDEGRIVLPSLACGLRDIISAVPRNWSRDEEIFLIHKGEQVGSFFLP